MKPEQPSKVVEECIRIVQEHLDREAGTRRREWLEPKELCAEQKAALLRDLAALLIEPAPRPATAGGRLVVLTGLLRRLWMRR